MLTVALLLQAQTTTDALSGGAGWLGAGLLGMVLGWLLMIHLPSKDKQLREFMESKDKLLDNVLQQKWQMLEKMSKEYREDLRAMSEHCEKELGRMAAQFSQDLNTFRSMSVMMQEFMDERREEMERQQEKSR